MLALGLGGGRVGWLRAAWVDDAQALAVLLRPLFEEGTLEGPAPEATQWAQALWAWRWWIAVDSEEALAALSLHNGEIGLAVAPKARGLGLGGTLLDVALRAARTAVVARMRRDNLAARALFAGRRFRATAAGEGDLILRRGLPPVRLAEGGLGPFSHGLLRRTEQALVLVDPHGAGLAAALREPPDAVFCSTPQAAAEAALAATALDLPLWSGAPLHVTAGRLRIVSDHTTA